MNHTTQPQNDFDGCRRACRLAAAHTLVWGECEHAVEPEPTVSLSRVYTDTDGLRSIGFDTYTVPELARLIEPALGDPLKAAAAARRIVHRHDGELRAAAPVPPPADRATPPAMWIDGHPQLEAIAAAMWERCEHHDSGLIIDDPRNIAVAALASLPAPADGPGRVAAEEQPTETQDDTDLTEADVDRMMAEGVPVQIVTAPPATYGAQQRPAVAEQPDTQTREADRG